MDVSFREEDTHLVVRCRGEWEPAITKEIIRRIRNKAEQTSNTRIFVDCLDVAAPSKEFHRYLAGIYIAKMLPPPFKTAVLYRKELITKFSEDVAVNRGGSLFVCSNEEEALDWLLNANAYPTRWRMDKTLPL